MKLSDFLGLSLIFSFLVTVLSVIYSYSEYIGEYFEALLEGNYLVETAGISTAIFFILLVLTNEDLFLIVRQVAKSVFMRVALLQEGSVARTEPTLTSDQIRAIINQEIKGISTTSIDLTDEERLSLLRQLEHRLEIEIGKNFDSALRKKYVQDSFETLYLRSLNRLKEQVAVLGSRANTSLMIGIVFSVSGLLALYFTFFSSIDFSDQIRANEASNTGYLDLMREFLPRLSLVLIIEIVGFFFLRLYSKALGELRYAQNETTNVELKLIALTSAIANELQDSTIEVISSLAKTERNNIIERTQTTIEIEKERSSREGEAGTINAISSLLHGTEKGWFGRKRE